MKKEVILLFLGFLILILLISGCGPKSSDGIIDWDSEVDKELQERGFETPESEACKGAGIVDEKLKTIKTVEECQDISSPDRNIKPVCKAIISQDISYCKNANFYKSSTWKVSEEDQKKVFDVKCKAAAKRDPTICEEYENLDVTWSSKYDIDSQIGACRRDICQFGLV